MKYFDIVGKRNWFFGFSLLVIVIGLIFGFVKGVNLDIDFKGGTVMNVNLHTNQFQITDVKKIVTEKTGEAMPVVLVAGVNNDSVSIRTSKDLAADESKALFDAIKTKYNLPETDPESVDTINPIIGKELQTKGTLAITISSILLLLYIAIMFRKMGGFIAGLTSIVALIHDILILLAVYLIAHIPMNIAFIAAALTILGYSMNDTIIVYDRIRENEKLLRKVSIAELVNKSIIQTLGRTINTVVTVLIMVITLYIFGVLYNVDAIKEFTLPLLIGIITGTYSSIFIASSLYVAWNEFNERREKAVRTKKA